MLRNPVPPAPGDGRGPSMLCQGRAPGPGKRDNRQLGIRVTHMTISRFIRLNRCMGDIGIKDGLFAFNARVISKRDPGHCHQLAGMVNRQQLAESPDLLFKLVGSIRGAYVAHSRF